MNRSESTGPPCTHVQATAPGLMPGLMNGNPEFGRLGAVGAVFVKPPLYVTRVRDFEENRAQCAQRPTRAHERAREPTRPARIHAAPEKLRPGNGLVKQPPGPAAHE